MPQKKEIIINPLLSQKEAEVKALEKKYKGLLAKLETEKLKLRQLKDDMVDKQRQAFSALSAKMEQVKQLQAELKILFQQAGKSKLFNRQEKKTLKEMAKEMEGDFFGGASGGFERPINEEEQEARSADFFKTFSVAPAMEEGQNIRKLFLKLATRFHPDKATSDQEAKHLHSLMQRINEAYKAGDMAELLAIEAQYLASEQIESTDSATQIDLMQKRIDRLIVDISLLEDQLRRVKQETGNINRSDAGKMHKQMKKNTSPVDFMTQDINQMIQGLTILRDGLKIYLETGIMPPALARQLQPNSFYDIDLDEMLDVMLEVQEQEERRRRAKKKAGNKKIKKNIR